MKTQHKHYQHAITLMALLYGAGIATALMKEGGLFLAFTASGLILHALVIKLGWGEFKERKGFNSTRQYGPF